MLYIGFTGVSTGTSNSSYRRVKFNEKARTVRVEFDASRMKRDTVANMLRQAGIDLKQPALA
jgi:hypothetical protein